MRKSEPVRKNVWETEGTSRELMKAILKSKDIEQKLMFAKTAIVLKNLRINSKDLPSSNAQPSTPHGENTLLNCQSTKSIEQSVETNQEMVSPQAKTSGLDESKNCFFKSTLLAETVVSENETSTDLYGSKMSFDSQPDEKKQLAQSQIMRARPYRGSKFARFIKVNTETREKTSTSRIEQEQLHRMRAEIESLGEKITVLDQQKSRWKKKALKYWQIVEGIRKEQNKFSAAWQKTEPY